MTRIVPIGLILMACACYQVQGQVAPGAVVDPPPSVVHQPVSLWDQDCLTGDWGGVRTKLADKGVVLGVQYTGDLLANPVGGIRQGVIQDGCLELALDLDFKALAGLDGGSFHANSYYIYGGDLSGSKIGNIMTVSNIEAYDTLRLYDLWYQQNFFDEKVSLRLGQLAADDEFFVTNYGAMFVNGTFGWPPLTGANLPSGGSAYPLATPGVRLKVCPLDQFSLMAGVFDGDPGDGSPVPQKHNNSGTTIDLNQGAFSIFEAAYKLNQEKDAKGLPGTYTLGGFYCTKNFSDLHVDDMGLSLADPASSGNPRQHSGDWGIYFMVDQMVWKKPSASTCDQGLGAFWRVGGAPSDRNPVEFYTDGGLNFKGPFPGRDQDIFALGAAYCQISHDLRDLDQDNDVVAGKSGPIQDDEIAIELTYQAKLNAWWTVQPDVQYIIHPGGHAADPNDGSGTQAIPNAVVLGVRTIVTF